MLELRDARATLGGIDGVSGRMEPAARIGAEVASPDWTADGFPLFGHGPGGWFGVTPPVRRRDGREETLDRRGERPD